MGNEQAHRRRTKAMLPFLLSLALLALGIVYVYSIWTKYSNLARQRTMELAGVAVSVVSIDEIGQLTGSADDSNTQAYAHIKADLMRITTNNAGVNDAYLIKSDGSRLVFLANAQPDGADGYISPGQIYSASAQEPIQVLSTGAPALFSIGPGPWTSVFVPVTDGQTGEVIAVFGLDYSTQRLTGEIRVHVIHAFVMVLTILVFLFILYFFMRKRREMRSMSKRLDQRERIFRAVFEQAPVGIAIGHDKMLISDINPAFETIVGRTGEELGRIGWPEYTHPDDLSVDLANFERMQAGEISGYAMEKRFIRPDGSIVWANMNVVPLNLTQEEGESHSGNHLCIIENITKRIRAELALLESERSKSVLLSNLPGMAYRCRYDKNWTMEFVSDGCKALTGYTPNDLVDNASLTYYDLILPQYCEALWREWLGVLAMKTSFRYEYEIHTADGNTKWVLELGQGIYDESNKVSAIEGIVIDISAQKEREAQVLHLHNHDPLTGLYNRKYLNQEIERLDRLDCLPVTYLVADINGLRLINEAFGYLEGDKLIRTVADLFKACARRGDTLARIGGDTFVVLMPHADNKAAHAMFKAIVAACEQFNENADTPFEIDLSIGYATRTSIKQSMQEISNEAELFMHNRKLLSQRSSYSAIVSSMMATVFEKSQETEEHAQRMADLCRTIGERLSLPDMSLDELKLFAMLHDIGKIAVHDEILNKQEPLTDEEWAILKKHPETGYRIAMSTPDLAPIAEYILYHHERWDGAGYPKGLKGEEIPLLSRILAVADAYDAMTQERSYRYKITKSKAISEIERNAGTQFDPHVVAVFMSIMRETEDGWKQEGIMS